MRRPSASPARATTADIPDFCNSSTAITTAPLVTSRLGATAHAVPRRKRASPVLSETRTEYKARRTSGASGALTTLVGGLTAGEGSGEGFWAAWVEGLSAVFSSGTGLTAGPSSLAVCDGAPVTRLPSG